MRTLLTLCHGDAGSKMGEIAKLLAGAESGESPLQLKLHALGVRLGIASLICSAIVFIIGVSTSEGSARCLVAQTRL
jgi:magnesium-transporting ATPase (P-type)